MKLDGKELLELDLAQIKSYASFLAAPIAPGIQLDEKTSCTENLLSFKDYLDDHEKEVFEIEVERIEGNKNKMLLELMQKYNAMVSDRISRDVLLNEIMTCFSLTSSKVISVLQSMDDKSLQSLFLLVRTINKEKSK